MDNETVIRLIEAYKNKEVLWNPYHRNYYNRILKKDAWDELSQEMERTAEELKKKIEYLLAALRREKQKMAKSKTTGQGADTVYKSTWFDYPHLTFLLDKNKPRERLSTEDSNTEEKGDTESEDESSQSLIAVSHKSSDDQVPENVSSSPRTETEPFTTPPIPTKRTKKKMTEKDPIVMEALQLMRSSAQVAAATAVTPVAPDSFQIYANYLASKFRTYSQKTFISVEHQINNILYSADNDQYEWERGCGTSSNSVSRPEHSLSDQCFSHTETSSTENFDTNLDDNDSGTQDFSDLIRFNKVCR